eukprot:Colp12_sorted_trinity150504_noHs@15791
MEACSGSTPNRITRLEFTEQFMDQFMHFQVLALDQSYFVWVGLEAKMGNLTVAMPPKYSSMPSASQLMGSPLDEASINLARRLAVATKKQVFVSLNLPVQDSGIAPMFAEKKLLARLKTV